MSSRVLLLKTAAAMVCLLAFCPIALKCYAAEETTHKSELRKFEKDVCKKASVNYLLYLPAAYAQSKDPWPLVLWLHGDGGQENRGGIAEIKSYGPPHMAEEGKEFPFILLAPQLWGDVHWDADILHALLQEVMHEYRVDADRVYLMGYSRGGFGAWELGCSYPDTFAAVVAISGRPMTAVERLKDCGVWIFHGEEDKGVPVDGARNMYDGLKSAGGDVRITVYPGVGHDACSPAMATKELWDWLLEQRRKKK